MYAGCVDAVNIPAKTANGYPAILKTGYVYWVTESRWDPLKGKTVDKRVSIGKKSDQAGKMFPNKNYELLFGPIDPEATAIRKSLQISIPESPEQLSPADKLDFHMAYGPYVAMRSALAGIGALDALKRAFPKCWRKIFAKALHAVVAEDSTAQLYPGWAFDNYAGLTRNLSDSEISALYAEIGEDETSTQTFFQLYCKAFHKSFPLAKERVVAFDSTNQVTESRNQSQAKYGKSKTGEALPIINTAMYVDQETGIPLWYEHFDGNILDKTQTPYTVEKAVSLGYEKVFLVMDRGYFSAESVKALQAQELGFAMMMPEVADVTTDTIKRYRDELRNNPKYFIPEQQIFGCSTEVTVAGYKLYAFVFYDDDTAKEERDAVNSKLAFYIEELKKKKRYTEKMAAYFEKRAIIVTKTKEKSSRNEPNFSYSIDQDKVQKAYEEAGFFMMLSNRPLPPVVMIGLGRQRDSAEKAFRHLKYHFNLSRAYSHRDATYDGKMFVAFISLLMLCAFAWYCRSILRGKRNATTASLISELYRYKMLKKPDGSWMPAYALNRQQKDVFECLDVAEDSLKEEVRALHL